MSEKYTYKPEIEAIQFVDGNENDVLALLKSMRVEDIHIRYNCWNKLDCIEYELKNNICGSAIAGDWIVKKTYSNGSIDLVGMTDYGFRREFEKAEEPIITPDTVANTVSTTAQESNEPVVRVANGAIYWYVSHNGCVTYDAEAYYPADDMRWKIGNYFRTKEEAEQARDKQLLELAAYKWRKQYDPVELDWGNSDERKYSIESVHNKDIRVDCAHVYRSVNALYFSTRELVEQFYNEHKDLVHKVLEVE